MGQKMSKSLGNGIDADSVLGAEPEDVLGLGDKGPEKSVQLKANKIGSSASDYGRHVLKLVMIFTFPEEIDPNISVYLPTFQYKIC